MKIGVLTYYGDLNCGTNLQAYATYRAVKKFYPYDEVEIIPLHTFIVKSKAGKYLPFLIYFLHYKIRRKYNQFKEQFLDVKNDIVIENVQKALAFISNRGYDKIYVGADTLLELDRLPKGFDGLSAYWLKDVPAKKFLIAASAKNVEYNNLSSKQRKDMEIASKQFTSIAIRDRSTEQLLNHFVPKEKISYIADPTFTLDINYGIIDEYLKKKKIKIPSKSVLIHAAFSEKWPKKLVIKLHDLGYTIVAPRYNTWADIVLSDMSPLEQLGIYRYFKFVITHRFHDCVFCLKNNTPVFAYVKEKHALMTSQGEAKHVSLLKDFGLYPQGFLGCPEEDDFSDIDIKSRLSALYDVFNASEINMRIERMSESYYNYLKNTVLL